MQTEQTQIHQFTDEQLQEHDAGVLLNFIANFSMECLTQATKRDHVSKTIKLSEELFSFATGERLPNEIRSAMASHLDRFAE